MQALGRLMERTLPNLKLVYCIDHVLQLIASAVANHPSIVNALDDIRDYVTAARPSPIARAALRNRQKQAGARRPLSLIADVRARRRSARAMLKRLDVIFGAPSSRR